MNFIRSFKENSLLFTLVLVFATASCLCCFNRVDARDIPIVKHTVGTNFSGAYSVISADIDGDGDLDVAGGAMSGGLAWWENTSGDGSTWTKHTLDASFSDAQSVVTADVDNDGDLDVVGVSYNLDQVAWYENTAGDGSAWTKHVVDSSFNGAYCVFVADMDRDGDIDIIAAGRDANEIAWWENTAGDGSAWTKHSVDSSVNSVKSVYVADVDGDGDLDIVGASYQGGGPIAWWENTAGNGSAWTRHNVDTSFNDPYSVFVADIDGDGDMDIVAAAYSGSEVAWWENTAGDGSAWTKHSVASFTTATSVFVADLDGDGDMDIAGASDNGHQVAWFENTAGDGSSWTKHTLDSSVSSPYSIFASDLDGDGDLDVLAPSYSGSSISWWQNETIHRSALFPDPDGRYTVSSAFSGAECVVSADVNGNGVPDLIGAASGANEIAWFENSAGDGSAWTKHAIASSFTDPSVVYAADMNRDGAMDVVGAAYDGIKWWENTAGDGSTWTSHTIDGTVVDCFGVWVADLDRDGDLDILAESNNHDQVLWYENTAGDGSVWTKHTIDSSVNGPYQVIAADLDGDGDLDVATGADGDFQVIWYENTAGDASAWTKHVVGPLFAASVLNACDVDGDGDLDLVAGGAGSVVWFENTDGSGASWTKHNVDTSVSNPESIVASDLDNDGDIDFIVPEYNANRVAWWENRNGVGTSWTKHVVNSSFGEASWACVADVNRDGRPDIVAAAYSANTIAWWEDLGGQFALSTTSTAPSSMAPGEADSVLKIKMNHRGRSGDNDEELATLDLLFESTPGVPMTTSDANTLFSNLKIYLDDGSGSFEPGSDTLVATVSTFNLTSGVQTVTFTDGDANVQVPYGSSKTFLVVPQIDPSLTGATAPVNQFLVTHVTETCSTAKDSTAGIPLILEYVANKSTPVIPVSGLDYTWDGGGSTNNWSEAANWTGFAAPNSSSNVFFDATSTKDALIDSSFTGSVGSITVDAAYTGTIMQSQSLTVAGSLIDNGGSYVANAALAVGGDFVFSTGIFNGASGSLTLNGSGSQQFDMGGGILQNLTIDNSGGSAIAAASPLDVKEMCHLQQGSLQCSGDIGTLQIDGTASLTLTGDLSVSGDWTNVGTFDPGSYQVLFRPESAQTVSGGSNLHFHDLVINDGFLGYWKCDDGSGSTAADDSGFGHPATLYHTTAWSTDVPSCTFRNDHSLLFTRANADYAKASGTTEINNLQKLTIACWVKLNTMPAGVIERFVQLGGGEKAVLRYDGVSGTARLHFYMNIGGSLHAITADNVLSAGSWFHVAGTYDGTTMHLYLNGTEVGTPVLVSGTVGTGSGVTFSHSGGDEALDGWLDDVRIYDRALSPTEIQTLAQGDLPSTSTGSVTLTSPATVDGDLTLNSGTLEGSGSGLSVTVAGNLTRNGGVWTPGSGTVTFDGTSEQEASGPLDFYTLTQSNPAGVRFWSNAALDGALNLTSGDLTFESSRLLNLGTLSTATGDFDVVGETYRNNPQIGVTYTFGSPYTTLTFNSGSPPDFATVTLEKTAPTGLSPAVDRNYSIFGKYASCVSTVRLHYRDAELDGTLEDFLNIWRADIGAPSWQLRGSSSADTSQNWVEVSGIAFTDIETDTYWALSSLGSLSGEASGTGSPLTAANGSGTAVTVTYTPGDCATDHTVYWGAGPISGALSWTGEACSQGSSGSASFDPGDPAPGSFIYFVVAGNNGTYEGSYGKDSSSTERPEATGLSGCDYPQELTGACP